MKLKTAQIEVWFERDVEKTPDKDSITPYDTFYSFAFSSYHLKPHFDPQ